MEVTMQWWDMADDLWFAARLRLAALEHWLKPMLYVALAAAAGLLLLGIA